MFDTVDSVPRQDISTVLMEAIGQEKLYIAQEIMPVFDSHTEVGRYPKFTKQLSELLRAGGDAMANAVVGGVPTLTTNTRRNASGTYLETSRKFTWDSYMTEEYGMEERVDDVVARRMENFFDAEMVTAKFLMNDLMLDYEITVASILNNPAPTAMNPNGFTQQNASTAWTIANLATMDVPEDMNTVIESLTLLGEQPEAAVMSLHIWNIIRRSTKLQTYIYGFLNVTQGGSQITPDMFAACFGLQRLYIAKKSVDVAPKGLAPNLVPVWGNANVLVGTFRGGDFQNGGVGRSIIWSSDSVGGLFASESYRDERRRGSMLRVRSSRVIKTVNSYAMQQLVTGWAPNGSGQ
jgi:hypothetical protein